MRIVLAVVLSAVVAPSLSAQTNPEALACAKKAVAFLTEQVSTDGGYLWRYSADLSRREGEGVVTTRTVWVQPPGTPTLGEAFLDLYEATGDSQFLAAAHDVGAVLLKGQMRSGGWQHCIELEPERRRKWQYRIDPPTKKGKDQSSLDDNKTQASLHFLIRLDGVGLNGVGLDRTRQTGAAHMNVEAIHEAAIYGLQGLLEKGQLPGGGFPQVWTDRAIDRPNSMTRKASYPEDWPRHYTGHHEYWYRYTLNDNLAGDVTSVLILAEKVYGDVRYREALRRLADSLIRTQMPMPQPAWAQQYSDAVQPIWARKFEPPAITTSESFDVIETLIRCYAHTGQAKYLEPVSSALDYLESCRLPDGQVPRFLELRTNRPLYFNRKYELTYRDDDLPTHYGFQRSDATPKLRRLFTKVRAMSASELAKYNEKTRSASVKRVRAILANQDERGAWVTNEGLRFHPKSNDPADQRVIDMRSTVENLKELAAFL